MNYLSFINEMLAQQYSNEVKAERVRFESLIDEFQASLNSTDTLGVLGILADLDRFLSKVANGQKIMRIYTPSAPAKIGLSATRVIALSLVAGGICGVLFIFFLDSFRKRKAELAKLSSWSSHYTAGGMLTVSGD